MTTKETELVVDSSTVISVNECRHTHNIGVHIEDPNGKSPEDMYGYAYLTQDQLKEFIGKLQKFVR